MTESPVRTTEKPFNPISQVHSLNELDLKPYMHMYLKQLQEILRSNENPQPSKPIQYQQNEVFLMHFTYLTLTHIHIDKTERRNT